MSFVPDALDLRYREPEVRARHGWRTLRGPPSNPRVGSYPRLRPLGPLVAERSFLALGEEPSCRSGHKAIYDQHKKEAD